MEVFWIGIEPGQSGAKIEGESGGIKGADSIEHWENVEEIIEEKQDDGDDEIDSDGANLGEIEAEQMKNLYSEESDNAGSGSIIKSENNIGNAGGKHGKDEEIILRKSHDDIKQTEADTTEFDESNEIAFGCNDAENQNDKINNGPDNRPDWCNSETFYLSHG